jgi:hypothetical protein
VVDRLGIEIQRISTYAGVDYVGVTGEGEMLNVSRLEPPIKFSN